MIKKSSFIFSLAGLFIVLQGCCYDNKGVDILLANKTPEQIYVHMRLNELTNGEDEGTKELLTRPWIFKKIPPNNTYIWKDIGVCDGIWMVIIRQNTIDKHDSAYLKTHCLYDNVLFFTKSQLNEINYQIEYK